MPPYCGLLRARGNLVPARGTARDFPILAAAKDIYNGNFCPELDDLTDAEVIDNGTFALILNALLIAKYGADALAIHGQENRTEFS